jgi:hypothetical protein
MRPGGLTDKEGAMIEYWSVIGRLVARPDFRDEVFKCRNSSRTHSDLADLYEYLCGVENAQCKLRLARWEVCDVNRFANELHKALEEGEDGVEDALKAIADAWKDSGLEETSLEQTALLGLLVIDETLLADYVDKTADEILARSKKSPTFGLEKEGADKYRKFFQSAGAALKNLSKEERAWIPPKKSLVMLAAIVVGFSALKAMFLDSKTKVQCSGGQTLMKIAMPKKLAYTHLQPAFVDRLAARLMPKRIARFLGI